MLVILYDDELKFINIYIYIYIYIYIDLYIPIEKLKSKYSNYSI